MPGNAHTIGLLYLARAVEGPAAMRRFKASYLNAAPGIDHDLIVIYKGADDAAMAAARAVFADLPHTALTLPDTGFDIGSYLAAADAIDHEYLCCINTFTELRAPGWLASLHRQIAAPGIGIVGASASYESIQDSMRMRKWVTWLCTHDKIKFDPKIAQYYGFVLEEGCQDWLAQGRAEAASRRTPKSMLRNWRRRRRFQRRWPNLLTHLRDRWRTYTADGEMTRLLRFPAFPNPHIRSTGFLVLREHLVAARHGEIRDKLDACEFESGADSLTWQLRRQGLRALVVDRAGTGFDVADWTRSRTFRLSDQQGLMMDDNRTRDFDAQSPAVKATQAWMSWGDYIAAPPRDLPRLGMSFPVDANRTGR